MALTGHTGDVYSVAVTPDGRYALSGSEDRTVRWWDLDSGRCLRALTGHGPVLSVAVTPDGCHAVSGSDDGTVMLWEMAWDYEFSDQ